MLRLVEEADFLFLWKSLWVFTTAVLHPPGILFQYLKYNGMLAPSQEIKAK